MVHLDKPSDLIQVAANIVKQFVECLSRSLLAVGDLGDFLFRWIQRTLRQDEATGAAKADTSDGARALLMRYLPVANIRNLQLEFAGIL